MTIDLGNGSQVKYKGKWNRGVREGKVQISHIEGDNRAMLHLDSDSYEQVNRSFLLCFIYLSILVIPSSFDFFSYVPLIYYSSISLLTVLGA